VEDVVLPEIGAEGGGVLTSDRFVADADQVTGKWTVRYETWHGNLDQLAAAGVSIASSPADGPFGRRFTFLDPDEYALTIHDRA
jgi:predicted enzyme related to lactoylglutathione lyase